MAKIAVLRVEEAIRVPARQAVIWGGKTRIT
jgi:hypothetical protein